VKPTSSCPASLNNAAAAELSTPPLIATAIFISYPRPIKNAEFAAHLGGC
jgi:hypothetical protein